MDDTQTTGPATDAGMAAVQKDAPAANATSQSQDAPSTSAGQPSASAEQPSASAEQPGAPEEQLGSPNGDAVTGTPGFRERGRMRRRARFLRRARELAYRDLGGLVFDLHRFAQRNDTLVLAKLDTIGRIDGELRALESALAERQPVTVLYEAGVAACPRCAAIHGSDDRFCPNCGLAMDLRAERPVAGAAIPPQAPAQVAAAAPAPAPAPASPAPGPAPGPTPAPTPSTGPTPAPAPSTGPMSAPAPTTRPTPAPAPTPGPPHAPAPADTPWPARAQPAGPAPQSQVDQPTEIVRPPAQNR